MLLVDTRIDFYKQFPKNGIVAEIGVMKGVNAKHIYDFCQPKQLLLIDPWEQQVRPGSGKKYSVNEWHSFYQHVISIFDKYNNVTIIKNYSIVAATTFDNYHFDIVYMDAGHSYESVKEDLMAWYPKIKTGGIIAGHDYTDTQKTREKQFGVVRAVNEFMELYNLKLYMLSNTLEKDWAIKI